MPYTKIKAAAYQKRLREERKRNGFCPSCSNRKKHKNHIMCKKCLDRSRDTLRTLKKIVLKGYGNRCACCKIRIWEFLSVDHVVERGADERRRLGRKRLNSGSFYRKIIKERFPDCYQILCYNCNMSLGFFGYCPHRPYIKRPVRRNG